jgi:hypothetical protein
LRTDNQWEHLHPAFRSKLEKIVEEVSRLTVSKWVLVEGYRSQARQTELYAQGRTQPGKIVTWVKSPRWHGCGLAADLAPTHNGQVWYACPRSYWETLRRVYQKVGLGNPAWSKGDLGHVQSLNKDFRATAQAWCERGFK